MTRDDLTAVFVLLRGRWPHSCPSIDSQIDVAAHFQTLDPFDLAEVAAAIEELARTREFCPPVGIIAEAVRTGPPKVPPYHRPIPIDPPHETGTDDAVVREAFTEARAALAEIRRKRGAA